MAPSAKEKGKQIAEDEPSHPVTHLHAGKHIFRSLAPNNSSEGGSAPKDAGANPSASGCKGKGSIPFDIEKYKARLAGVRENINKLRTTTLFATIIGDPLELKEIRKKIRFDWRFLEGGFQVIPMANNWFELKFNLPSDKEKVWNGRPYHIQSQLLLLKPWRQGFDPATEPLTTLDMWIRIPGLPAEFISESVLTSIIEENGYGKILKLDAFTAKGKRVRYPRICVSVDITTIPNKCVYVPNEDDQLIEYPVYLEEYPEGCGSCGMLDHYFADCPLRRRAPAPAAGVARDPAAVPGGASGDGNDAAGEWVSVAARRRNATPITKFGNTREAVFKWVGANASIFHSPPVSIHSDSSDGKASSKVGMPASPVKVASPPQVSEPIFAAEPPPFVELSSLMPEVPNDETFLELMVPRDSAFEFEDDDEMYMETELTEAELFVDGLDPLEKFSQEELEVFLQNIPPGEEFTLPNLSNPVALAESIRNTQGLLALSAGVTGQMEKLEVKTSSNSESSKRKSSRGEADTASSSLMGCGIKKPRNDK